MKLYAPKYYKEFTCIADKCKHSCCIGWEIDVDEEALEKYATLENGYGKEIIKSIDFEETPHFKLLKNDRCPHLDRTGLCKIIKNFGEGFLCHICREHPRFYNQIGDRMEVGLGISCEEACRIILNTDEYDIITEIGEICQEAEAVDFDLASYRKEIYRILSRKDVDYKSKLEIIYEKFGVYPSVCTDEEWRGLIDSLEYLDASHKRLFLNYSSELRENEENEKYSERVLAYFIYRHCSKAWDETEFREWLGFCLFCERLFASAVMVSKESVFEIARIISEEIEYSEDNTNEITAMYFEK